MKGWTCNRLDGSMSVLILAELTGNDVQNSTTIQGCHAYSDGGRFARKMRANREEEPEVVGLQPAPAEALRQVSESA